MATKRDTQGSANDWVERGARRANELIATHGKEAVHGPFEWIYSANADTDQRGAVAWHVDDGVMVAFVFATTQVGLVDLVGLDVRCVTSEQSASNIAGPLVTEAVHADPLPVTGLTSRQIRTATAHQGLLADARRRLVEGTGGSEFKMRGQFARGDTHDDVFYARLAVRYGSMSGARGARQDLADEYGVSDSTVRNWITEATKRGMWATAGRGRVGSPTAKAFELVQEERS
jgi:hypothetical protein